MTGIRTVDPLDRSKESHFLGSSHSLQGAVRVKAKPPSTSRLPDISQWSPFGTQADLHQWFSVGGPADLHQFFSICDPLISTSDSLSAAWQTSSSGSQTHSHLTQGFHHCRSVSALSAILPAPLEPLLEPAATKPLYPSCLPSFLPVSECSDSK